MHPTWPCFVPSDCLSCLGVMNWRCYSAWWCCKSEPVISHTQDTFKSHTQCSVYIVSSAGDARLFVGLLVLICPVSNCLTSFTTMFLTPFSGGAMGDCGRLGSGVDADEWGGDGEGGGVGVGESGGGGGRLATVSVSDDWNSIVLARLCMRSELTTPAFSQMAGTVLDCMLMLMQ